MTFLAYILIATGVVFIFLAHYHFIQNAKEETYDAMGASINFDQPLAIGNLLICVALGLIGLIPWYLGICVFLAAEAISLPYKWSLLEPLAKKFLSKRGE